jgi:hypothetical protein
MGNIFDTVNILNEIQDNVHLREGYVPDYRGYKEIGSDYNQIIIIRLYECAVLSYILFSFHNV